MQQDRHLIHHLYPSVPWYRYRAVFRKLRPLVELPGSDRLRDRAPGSEADGVARTNQSAHGPVVLELDRAHQAPGGSGTSGRGGEVVSHLLLIPPRDGRDDDRVLADDTDALGRHPSERMARATERRDRHRPGRMERHPFERTVGAESKEVLDLPFAQQDEELVSGSAAHGDPDAGGGRQERGERGHDERLHQGRVCTDRDGRRVG